jgi:hypothetical protein
MYFNINTKNISFLKTAMELKNEGIENNTFFLYLCDPSIQDLDPFSPDLSSEEELRIFNEVINNPWYFLRECVRIPIEGGHYISFELHRANLASIYCFLNNIDHYLSVPRQMYKTISYCVILEWVFSYNSLDSDILYMNMSQDDASRDIQKTDEINLGLPRFLQTNHFRSERSLVNPILRNKITSYRDPKSVDHADKIGRQMTQPIQFMNEIEFIKYIETMVNASTPAYYSTAERSERLGTRHCRIMTSTFGDEDMESTKFCMHLIKYCAIWTEKVYDMGISETQEYLAKNSGNNMFYIKYNYDQLGKDEKWFKNMSMILNNNPDKINRELLLKRRDEI